MDSIRDQVLSEFIDAWNAGERPDIDDYVMRVEEQERGELAEQIVSFLQFAPTPSYDEKALDAIRAEPIVVAALGPDTGGGLLSRLLTQLRERASMSSADVASELVKSLDLPASGQPKTARYVERLERGELEPARVSGRVFDALATLFRIPRDELEGAAGWMPKPAAPAAVFRADEDAGQAVSQHLEVLADALEAPGGETRDEIDDLFLGGR